VFLCACWPSDRSSSGQSSTALCYQYQSKAGECVFTAGRRTVFLAVVKRRYTGAFDREDSTKCDGKRLADQSCACLGFRTLPSCHDHHLTVVVAKKAFG